jgi:hypothetical protein
MKHFLLKVFFGFSIFLATAHPTYAAIQYFGYFGSNFIGENASLAPAETADHTNVIWVYQGSPTWKTQIQEGIRLGQKTVLDVLPIFFDDTSSARDQLLLDYQSRWQAFAASLTSELTANIAAFYHVDELPPDISDILVTWTGVTTPQTGDWIGMYPQGASDSNYVARLYVSSASCSRTNGGAGGSCTFPSPQSAGVFEFRLFTHDTLTKLALSNPVLISNTTAQPFSSVTPEAIGAATLVASPVSLGFIGSRTQAVRTINALIKSSFPSIPIATVFSGSYDLRPEQIASGFDWVGFDCYADFYVCQIPQRLATLKSLLSTNQKIILIPEGNSFTASDSQLVERATLFYNLALSEPKVVAIFPITWSNYMEGSVRVWGTKNLPLLRARYGEIGRAITGKNISAVALTVSMESVNPGQNLTVAWSGRANPNHYDWIGLYAPGANDSAYLARLYVASANCTKINNGMSGSCVFPAPSSGGTYEFRMFDADTLNKLVTSNTFNVNTSTPVAPPSAGGTGSSSGGRSSSGSTTVGREVGAAATTGSSFSRNLKVGMRGEDVKRLQIFLNTKGFIIAKTGAGSPGQETDYFGTLTAQAVSRFQEFYAAAVLRPVGLTRGTGFVGESTRRFMQGL